MKFFNKERFLELKVEFGAYSSREIVIKEEMLKALKEFRDTGDRELLCDILEVLVKNQRNLDF